MFDGRTSLTTYPSDSGKTPAVTTSIISTRKIINNGSTGFYGTFWAGQCFIQSGSSKIYGSIAVQGTPTDCGNGSAISGSGKMKIDTSYRVDNTSLYGAFGLKFTSRR